MNDDVDSAIFLSGEKMTEEEMKEEEAMEKLEKIHRNVPLSPEFFKKSWEYKYVLFDDGVVWFGDACSTVTSHKCIAVKYKASGNNAPPVFAGKILVRGKRWYVSEGGSTSLNLHRGESDDEYIDKVLSQYGYKNDPELRYE